MADAGEQITFEDAGQAISLGRRNLLVRDYDAAVSAFGDGCAMLSSKHGEMADELGEPYLLYGKALLGLSREEQTVLGSAVPGSDETTEEVDGEGEAGAEADAEAESEAAESEAGAEGEAETETEEKEKDKEENTEESKSNETVSAEGETTASASVSVSQAGVSSENTPSEAAGPSESTVLTNGKASTSKIQQNGDAHDDGEADDDDDDNDDEDTNNLQLAWEVLELAKLILLKRGPPGWKLLAETHRMLGEVAMESGNQPGALTDLNACLDLLRKIEPADPRSMAETYYQLGLAYALGNEFDNSIEQFKEAISLLETRIKELEDTTETPQTDDPFYTVAGEIKELKELLPEIQEKIADMRDFKQQAAKMVIEGIKNHVSGGSCSNGAGPSGEGSSSSSSAAGSSKPASDISHLVRKKRKNEEEESSASPCKKPTPEKVP